MAGTFPTSYTTVSLREVEGFFIFCSGETTLLSSICNICLYYYQQMGSPVNSQPRPKVATKVQLSGKDE